MSFTFKDWEELNLEGKKSQRPKLPISDALSKIKN